MIVLDASAALSGLFNAGQARTLMGAQQLHAPHLIDAEVASGLRRHVASGLLDPSQGKGILTVWQRLGVTRYPIVGMLDRLWQLREAVSSYDACYVALAEHLDCALVTADARLTRAPGIRCPLTLVSR